MGFTPALRGRTCVFLLTHYSPRLTIATGGIAPAMPFLLLFDSACLSRQIISSENRVAAEQER